MCTDFLLHVTSDSPNQPFGNFSPLKSNIKTCQILFGEMFDLKYMQEKVKSNRIFLKEPTFSCGSRVIFSNSDFDPWHKGGYFKNHPNDFTDSYFIEGYFFFDMFLFKC